MGASCLCAEVCGGGVKRGKKTGFVRMGGDRDKAVRTESGG